MNNRLIRITTPPTLRPLLFERMTGEETLGRPFAFEVDLLCESSEIDLASMLGKRMTVHLDTAHGERHFNGVVTQFRVVGSTRRYTRYRASLRPDLSLLTYTQNCRIFQHKTVPDILKQIFDHHGVVFSKDKLAGEYRKWDYVVQYRESDFNFVSRLMEQEGIYYFVRHTEDNHTLMLVDEVSALGEAPGYAKVPFLPPEETGRVKEEHIFSWTAGARVVPGKFTVRDFRFDNPTELPTSTVESQIRQADGSPRAGAKLEVYDWPGEHKTVDEARAEARNRLLEHEAWYQTVEAMGDARGLAAGHRFTVTDLPRTIQSDKSYVIVKASYMLQGNAYESDGQPVDPQEFSASYTLIDAKTEYRTPRETPKPHVHGPQTATVVGHKNSPASEEIVTDEHGRVLVKFHWDRRGDFNGPEEDSADKGKDQSCFIRVSQLWAGSGWGGIHIPRIGQEVIVDFLEGDPDRPIITGRVYNGDNKPPYALTANATQSGIKSRSSKGGTPGNFNEIRFEDKKGSEQLYIQAEKNQDILVKASETHTVGADRVKKIGTDETTTVGGNRTETVTKDEKVTIMQNQILGVTINRTITVGSSQSESVGTTSTETVGAAKALTVGAAYQVTVAAAMNETVGGLKAEEIGGAKTVVVGALSSETVAGAKSVSAASISETAKNGFTATAGKDVSVTAGKNLNAKATDNASVNAGKKGLFDAGDELTLKAGDATITLKKNGDIVIKGKKILIDGSGDVVIKGSKIAEN